MCFAILAYFDFDHLRCIVHLLNFKTFFSCFDFRLLPQLGKVTRKILSIHQIMYKFKYESFLKGKKYPICFLWSNNGKRFMMNLISLEMVFDILFLIHHHKRKETEIAMHSQLFTQNSNFQVGKLSKTYFFHKKRN